MSVLAVGGLIAALSLNAGSDGARAATAARRLRLADAWSTGHKGPDTSKVDRDDRVHGAARSRTTTPTRSELPDFTFKNIDSVKKCFQAAGWEYDVQKVDENTYGEGTVMDQFPSAGDGRRPEGHARDRSQGLDGQPAVLTAVIEKGPALRVAGPFCVRVGGGVGRAARGTGRPSGRSSAGRRRPRGRRRPAAARGASAPAGPGRPSAGRTASVWIPWKRPSSQPTNWACAIRSSASLGIASSVNGRESRSSSSTSSGARPSSSSLTELAWISLSRTRLASSRGAARTSSSSCLIMLPIRMTLAGCSTISVTGISRESSSPRAAERHSVLAHDQDLGRVSGDRSFLGISMPPFSRTRTPHHPGAPHTG